MSDVDTPRGIRAHDANSAASTGGGRKRVQAAIPYYRSLARKEARVRQDQYVALSRLVQTLARRRVVRSGPRLTENTLIRVAIDLLLERANRLIGDTEAELCASVLDMPPEATAPTGPALFDLDAVTDE